MNDRPAPAGGPEDAENWLFLLHAPGIGSRTYGRLLTALGTPAAVTPAGVVDGLPVGVQVLGDRFSDLQVLTIAAEIEVEECAAPKGSYSLSARLVNPLSPSFWRRVRMRSRRPVRILCG